MPPVDGRLHPDEFPVDDALVRRLVDAQHPRWRHLPLVHVRSGGTDNVLFRLGPELVVRFPRQPSAVPSLRTELTWLPRLAPHLPVAVPEPVAEGAPGPGFPAPWAVYRWLDGETAVPERVGDPVAFAHDLAGFVRALRAVPVPAGAELPRSYRGGPLADRDAATRAALAGCADLVDADAALGVWTEALGLPVADGPPAWFHGDLKRDNVLVRDGRLSAVIDFGGLAVGDASVEQIVAWSELPAAVRPRFRAELGSDDATWARGRAWALSIGLVALAYYRDTNPSLAGISRHQVEQVLTDG